LCSTSNVGTSGLYIYHVSQTAYSPFAAPPPSGGKDRRQPVDSRPESVEADRELEPEPEAEEELDETANREEDEVDESHRLDGGESGSSREDQEYVDARVDEDAVDERPIYGEEEQMTPTVEQGPEKGVSPWLFSPIPGQPAACSPLVPMLKL
jgi:hypothetical protein